MISALKVCFMYDQDKFFLNNYKLRLFDKNSSILWKLFFFPLKSVHMVVLIFLFYYGNADFDNF